MEIKEQPAKLEILPFAVRLPPSALRGPGEGDDSTTVNPALAAVLHDTGVVGTITVMRKAVMIWFGWGKLEAENAVTEGESSSSSVASGRPPAMGPLIAAMPRTTYQGAFSNGGGNNNEGATTKLIGDGSSSESEDGEMLCRQTASRLSSRLGISVFCSCGLAASAAPGGIRGVDPAPLPHRAAALAEKRVYELLKGRPEL